MSAAERIVERMDGYSPAEHAAAIVAARERLALRREARLERARAAAERIRKVIA